MLTRKVYFFRLFAGQHGENAISKGKATREFIKMVQGEIIEGTEEEVDESFVTEEGQYKLTYLRRQ